MKVFFQTSFFRTDLTLFPQELTLPFSACTLTHQNKMRFDVLHKETSDFSLFLHGVGGLLQKIAYSNLMLLAFYFCLFDNLIIWVPVFCGDFGWFVFWLNHLLLHLWDKNSLFLKNTKNVKYFIILVIFIKYKNPVRCSLNNQFNFIWFEEIAILFY